MARKRMFDTEVINQDRFMDLSIGAKSIYFLLGMEADDEGFISPRRIIRAAEGTMDMLDELVEAGFLIKFDSGVVAIVDWHRNNYLDKTRVKNTIYSDERKSLFLNPETSIYQCLTNVQQMLKENRIEEYSIEENREEEISVVENRLEKNRIDKNREEEILCSVTLMNDDDIFVKKVIDCLNRIVNTHYNWEDKKTKDLIINWKNKKHTYLDFEIVINKMFGEWHNNKMSIHLNPYTLFGEKFEMYLNAPPKKKTLADVSMSDIDRMIAKENERRKNESNIEEDKTGIIDYMQSIETEDEEYDNDEFDRTLDDIFGVSKSD